MLKTRADKNILYVEAYSEEISYKKEFDESKDSDYYNRANAQFISDLILSEMFDLSHYLHHSVLSAIEIINYIKKKNIKKMHIYLSPKTRIVKHETDILGIETERTVDIPEYDRTLAILLYKFDRDVMHWFDEVIQNVLKVVDRDKIKVIYHFNPLIERNNCHSVRTTNDEVFVKTVSQNKVFYKDW